MLSRFTTSTVTRMLSKSALFLMIGLTATSTLAGCSDETPQSAERRTSDGSTNAHKTKWLEVSSQISPAQWLASRGEEAPRPLHDPEVKRVATLLHEAHNRYRESERMIANRSVQVEDMLQKLGHTENAVDILNDLAGITTEISQTEGYGSISQYYFNLRAASATRAEALTTLKTRYGSSM